MLPDQLEILVHANLPGGGLKTRSSFMCPAEIAHVTWLHNIVFVHAHVYV